MTLEFLRKFKTRKTAFEFRRCILMNGKVAHICNLYCIFVSFRVVREQTAHFFFCLEVPLRTSVAHCLMRFVQKALESYASKRILCFRIVFVAVVYVVCNYKRKIKFFGKFYHFFRCNFLVRKAVILKFYIVVVRTEKVCVFSCNFFCPFVIIMKKCLRNLSLNAGRKADKSFVSFFKHFKVDVRFSVMQSFCVSIAAKPAHVFVAGFVFAKKNKVIIFSAVFCAFLDFMVSFRYVEFAADNRIYTVCVADMFKIQHAEHISVVSKRKSRHVKLLCAFYERCDFRGTVQKRIV